MWPFPKISTRHDFDERLSRYAEKELTALLGGGRPRVGGVRVSPLAHTRTAQFRCVEIEGYGKLVVRGFHRRSHRCRAADFARLSDLLASNGVRTAQVLVVDDSPRTRRLYGFSVLAEEFLDGKAVFDVPLDTHAAVVDATADVLLRLHAIRSCVAGKPWEGVQWDPEQRVKALAKECFARLRRLGIGPGRQRCKALVAWFARQMRWLRRANYPLVHGDFHGKNILVLKDGSLGLVDFDTVSYWFPQADLVVAEIGLCRRDATAAARLLDRYFVASGECRALSREQYDATRSLFVAWHHMIKAGRRSRGVLKHQARGGPTYLKLHDKALGHWAKAEDALVDAGAP